MNEAGTFKLLCPTCDGKIFQDYENLEALKEVPSERMLEEIALKNVLLIRYRKENIKYIIIIKNREE